MWYNVPKKKDEEEIVTEEASADNESTQETDSDGNALHAMGNGGDGVPQELKDKLAEIRGDQDLGYTDVEVGEDAKGGQDGWPEHRGFPSVPGDEAPADLSS